MSQANQHMPAHGQHMPSYATEPASLKASRTCPLGGRLMLHFPRIDLILAQAVSEHLALFDAIKFVFTTLLSIPPTL